MGMPSTASANTQPVATDHSRKLEDQAATAALYVTSARRNSKSTANQPPKLSSAGAATSLKYAEPKNLPSYPISGLKDGESAAGAAASLGWANHKKIEQWKPDPSASASAAASHAKDYKVSPQWEPEQSASGTKAALTAHNNGGKVDVWKPEATSWGNSAASQAMKKDRVVGSAPEANTWGNSAATQALKKERAPGQSPEVSSWGNSAATQALKKDRVPGPAPEVGSWGNSAATQALKKERAPGSSPDVSSWGNSAAMQAFKNDITASSTPKAAPAQTAINRQGSLMAATGAMSGSRKRAESTPLPNPAAVTQKGNAALRAANSAHRVKKGGETAEGGAVPYTTMGREMFTSNPPVAPEVTEQNRADVLRASAVAMAKTMYNMQQKQFDATTSAQSGAAAAHNKRLSTSTTDEEVSSSTQYNNLQEAATKLAQERLAKLHNEHSKNREYRDYYGNNGPTQSRLSIRGRTRRRASSDGTLDEDKEQSNKIRAQMSVFSNNVTQVDSQKRKQDRENLIAAAQRNVTKSLHGMDERVYKDTGKVAPSLLTDWEVKAHAAAQAKSETRMENYGKVDIGGGKFVDQSVIDAVAARNVQPVLDEINEKAEEQRIRAAELKLEQENQQREEDEKKKREKELKDINRKLKQQDRDEEKTKRADEKAAEKAAKKEEERVAKDKRKPSAVLVPKAQDSEAAKLEDPITVGDVVAIGAGDVVEAVAVPTPAPGGPLTSAPVRTSMEEESSIRQRHIADAANKLESTSLSPTSPTDSSKVKTWFKRLSRRGKTKSEDLKDKDATADKTAAGNAVPASPSIESLDSSIEQNDSMRDVALAQTETPEHASNVQEHDRNVSDAGSDEDNDEPTPFYEGEEQLSRRSTVSSVSALSVDDFQEARDNFDEDLAPPPTFPARRVDSPVRDSRFTEDL